MNQEQLKSKIIKWAHAIKTWDVRWYSGIYPGEMAAFLGLCELCNICSIIESGRGEHAWSTQILGEYSRRTGVKVISIDFSPVENKPFHEQIKHYDNLRCIVGNTFNVLPMAFQGLQGPTSLLIDGPKMYPANRLSLVASIMFNIQVVAHHNCHLSSPWGKEFAKIFPGAFHYEDLGLSTLPEWQLFKQWEKKLVHNYEVYDEKHMTVGRSLQSSSLVMAYLPPGLRSKKRLLKLHKGQIWYHPLWLWLKWSVLNLIITEAKGRSRTLSIL